MVDLSDLPGRKDTTMMTLERAVQRCFDRCNLVGGDDLEIYHYMYQYKAIRELPEDQFEALYDELAERLGYCW